MRDLARCQTAVVHFGLAGAAVFHQGSLHRFYFLPDEMERMWEEERPGNSFGTGSVLTACLARHLIQPDDYPVFFAVTQALAAQRTAHHEGGGGGDELKIDLAYGRRSGKGDPASPPAAACIAPPQQGDDKNTARHLKGIEPFRTAWNPEKITVWPEAESAGLKRNRLLSNLTGTTPQSLQAKAVEVVIQGPKQALASAPKAAYGKFLTADRDEIESINEIRRLILEYQGNPADKRPLSLAVFGAPGSGKSFSIKQIARGIFGKEQEPLEFNLTQIKSPEDLHKAFHQVRDASVRLEIPLVFWDEFDTAGLKWLADFLAPMQDAEFFDGSHRHPFGKCVFVFAGGTCTTFGEFKAWHSPKTEAQWHPTEAEPWHQSFRDLKGPDFVSRLRGFLNIKGPNPTSDPERTGIAAAVAHDPAYVLRRALILRAEIERLYPDLVHPKTRRVAIAPNVLHALLTVNRYEHGARSITSLLTMSALTGARGFTVSALPAENLRRLHVSADFTERLADPAASADLHEPLARIGFEAWKAGKQGQGYVYGPQRNDDATRPPLAHPLIKDWSRLTPTEKAGNYDPVWRRLLAIRRLGYELQPQTRVPAGTPRRPSTELVAKLLAPEHEIWLADHLSMGWAAAAATNDWLRLHTDLKPFDELPKPQQDLNRAIVTDTLQAILDAGFDLVEAKLPPVNPPGSSPTEPNRP